MLFFGSRNLFEKCGAKRNVHSGKMGKFPRSIKISNYFTLFFNQYLSHLHPPTHLMSMFGYSVRFEKQCLKIIQFVCWMLFVAILRMVRNKSSQAWKCDGNSAESQEKCNYNWILFAYKIFRISWSCVFFPYFFFFFCFRINMHEIDTLYV